MAQKNTVTHSSILIPLNGYSLNIVNPLNPVTPQVVRNLKKIFAGTSAEEAKEVVANSEFGKNGQAQIIVWNA